MIEIIISVVALLLSGISLNRTSKYKNFDIKLKYLDELYEVRSKANMVHIKVDQRISMINEAKNICGVMVEQASKLKSKYELEGKNVPDGVTGFLDKNNKMLKEVLEIEKSNKEFNDGVKSSEENLKKLSFLTDSLRDKDFSDLHDLKTIIQQRLNEVEANLENVKEVYHELQRVYYSYLEEQAQEAL